MARKVNTNRKQGEMRRNEPLHKATEHGVKKNGNSVRMAKEEKAEMEKEKEEGKS